MRSFKENLCRFLKDFEKKDFHLFSFLISSKNSFSNLFFLISSKDLQTKVYEDLQKNEISRRSYVKIFVRSHSSEELKKDLGPGELFHT